RGHRLELGAAAPDERPALPGRKMGSEVVGGQPTGEAGCPEKNQVVRARRLHLRNSLRDARSWGKWNGRRRRPVSDHDARCTCNSPTETLYKCQAEVKENDENRARCFRQIARNPSSGGSKSCAKNAPAGASRGRPPSTPSRSSSSASSGASSSSGPS